MKGVKYLITFKKILFILKKNKWELFIIFFVSMFLPIIANIIPEFNSRVINAITHKNKQMIIYLTVSIASMYILKTFITIYIQNKIVKLNLNIMSNLKMEITSNIINQPLVFHENSSSQYILSRINEVDSFSMLFSTEMFTFFANVVTSFGALIMIAKKSIFLAVIAIIIMPIFFAIFQKLFATMNNQINNTLETTARTNENIHASLTGAYEIKQFNDEDRILKKIFIDINNLSNKLTVQKITVNKSGNLINMIVNITQIIFLCGVALTIISGNLNIGDYVALGQYLGLLYVPLISIQVINVSIKPALVSMKRLEHFLQENSTHKKQTIKHIKSISIKDLKYAYNKKIVLQDVSFKVNKGEKILIYGDNGCGKTTLAKILCGFYSDYEGNILIDGNEIRMISENSLREHIVMLSQKNYLFNVSIKENIRMANREISDYQFELKLKELIEMGLLENINLDDRIIENGKKLSGGQIQRIALARILIREADVYIFDEFENSLDSKSKSMIKKILETEFDDKICIFIAHDNFLEDIVEKIYRL